MYRRSSLLSGTHSYPPHAQHILPPSPRSRSSFPCLSASVDYSVQYRKRRHRSLSPSGYFKAQKERISTTQNLLYSPVLIQDGTFTPIIAWAETAEPSTTTGSADPPNEKYSSATQRQPCTSPFSTPHLRRSISPPGRNARCSDEHAASTGFGSWYGSIRSTLRFSRNVGGRSPTCECYARQLEYHNVRLRGRKLRGVLV